MNVWLLIAGVLVLLLALQDAIRTTLANSGGGPISLPLTRLLFRTMLAVHRGLGRRHPRLLQRSVPLIILMVPLTWVVLLWSGWLLLFSADPALVLDAQSREPADFSSRIYFVGYTVFTLGIGNYVPQDGLWEILTAVASLSGFFLITLSATYLIPLASAAAQEHQLAAVIADLGDTPPAIVSNAWDGQGFSPLKDPLNQLVPIIELHAQRHRVYPMLHYYYTPHRRLAITVMLSALDEALLLLSEGVHPDARLAEGVTSPARRAIARFMGDLEEAFLTPSEHAPPPPSLDQVAEAGIPVIESSSFERHAETHSEHRRRLKAYAESAGWRWADVNAGDVLARPAIGRRPVR